MSRDGNIVILSGKRHYLRFSSLSPFYIGKVDRHDSPPNYARFEWSSHDLCFTLLLLLFMFLLLSFSPKQPASSEMAPQLCVDWIIWCVEMLICLLYFFININTSPFTTKNPFFAQPNCSCAFFIERSSLYFTPFFVCSLDACELSLALLSVYQYMKSTCFWIRFRLLSNIYSVECLSFDKLCPYPSISTFPIQWRLSLISFCKSLKGNSKK